jgi:hypothetical protein
MELELGMHGVAIKLVKFVVCLLRPNSFYQHYSHPTKGPNIKQLVLDLEKF